MAGQPGLHRQFGDWHPGSSYGGCMVLNAPLQLPDEFNVGVDLWWVANWLRTLREHSAPLGSIPESPSMMKW